MRPRPMALCAVKRHGGIIKFGMLLALVSCSTQVDCSSVSCAQGGVTVDFSKFVATTPSAQAATVMLCVVNAERAPCSKPLSLSHGVKGVLFVPLSLPKAPRLSIDLTDRSKSILTATAAKIRTKTGPCCPGRAVLTLDGDGHPTADNRLFL